MERTIKLFANPQIAISSQEKITNNIATIGAGTLWKEGYEGKGIIVAVLDTGCNINHVDLEGRIIGGYNFSDDFDGDPTKIGDLNGHGTHVAGIIAASKNETGIVGVGPEINLLILKVLNERGSGSIDSLIKAIEYAINWIGPNGEQVNIISMSLGLSSPNEALHRIIKIAIEKNIAVVVAAGNEGDGNIITQEVSYPAKYPEVISVGAIDLLNNVADFSNTNDEVDLYAPGVLINSTYLNESFLEMSGTSMAAPHVTGALALLINKYENLMKKKPTENQLFNYLMQHTSKVYISDYDQTVSVLDLTKDVKIEEEVEFDKTLLLKCFCEARKTQAFFTQCLTDSSSERERDFLLDLIRESASKAEYIRNFCK